MENPHAKIPWTIEASMEHTLDAVTSAKVCLEDAVLRATITDQDQQKLTYQRQRIPLAASGGAAAPRGIPDYRNGGWRSEHGST
jgi:hypothetical protein